MMLNAERCSVLPDSTVLTCPGSTTIVLRTSFGTPCSGLDPCDIVPSDYVLSQLESLGQILSYCLVEGGQAQGGVSATPSPLGQSPL